MKSVQLSYTAHETVCNHFTSRCCNVSLGSTESDNILLLGLNYNNLIIIFCSTKAGGRSSVIVHSVILSVSVIPHGRSNGRRPYMAGMGKE